MGASDRFETFDIEEYLDWLGVEYWPAGSKNVSRGWIGIECLFCADNHNHLGINLTNKVFKCWLCDTKGNLHTLIKTLEGCGYGLAKKRVEEFQGGYYFEEDVKTYEGEEAVLPPEATNVFPPIHLNYLRGRGFDPEDLIPRYKLQACHVIGDYKFRIIIPLYLDGKLVNYNSRDVTDKADKKYVNCPNEQAVIPMRNLVYALDAVKDAAVIVEGPTDVWKVGPGAVSLTGMAYSREQVHYLLKNPAKRMFVMFDGEEQAQRNAYRLAKALSMSGKETEVIELPAGTDPGSLSQDDVRHLRNELKL